jgi:hypothetical protein
MKNIHLIPTDKPSRLFNCFGKLEIGDYAATRENLQVANQNIYITNDEEIKEGDWVITNNGLLAKVITEFTWHFINSKKIILTTDGDLIKDGVQAIDDEFLEWFVKNPSCKQVEVFKDFFQVNQNNPVLKGSTALVESYKIIIPIEGTPQETNEEASKRIYPDKTTPGWLDHWSATERRCFIEGAQWSQQEILYFLYEEITERRPYSSSKMCEVVIEFIQKMNLKK